MFANLPATTVKDTIENISQKGSTTLTSAPPGSVKRKGSPLNVHAKPKKEKVKSDRQKPITKFLTGKKRTSSNSDDNPPSKSYAVSETALSDLDLYPLPESTNSSHFPDQSLSELIQTSRKSQTSSSRTWSEIFTKPVPPNCTTHDEPCIQLVVKKPGLNCGRKFWICSRDVGPGYDNWSRPKDDIDERFRCGFFKWCNGN
ncbi:DNA-(apurinic or apyrimidinic site) lyase 2 [Neolecta irregularis DAH-3]|uniref:DNA-(Apurinic or apyrimidinic site) lyase 2 n=1 Tax=Neolecta irregularis (strain DAH-3) TaxID=1198029 RepID=A0A1U7LMH8_NEOID|nr:DNA-(apurinic or apyrimidinic site) lyase 2 [Neolecta irregularis DAH-3]|eukprot:OLL23865.1 DNA-(apurinic or apyrimidinic site) lyase 2 [Neolecta irregularis DAH-3]